VTISEEGRKEVAALVRPPERLKISEWAHKEAWMPEEGNAEPGHYSLARMPHQEEMLDDPLDPDAREIFWMMASQAAGKTTCLNLITEYTIKVWRKSVLVVRATLETAREWINDKFLPMTEATPCMRGLLKDPREKGSRSSMLKRRFPGGTLKVAGAKSPATFRGSSQGKVYQDEIDSYEVTKEGDPCALADRATITFSDATKLKCCTPTIKGFSRIEAGFERGDQRYYFVPCVCCGRMQWLKTEQMKFSFTAEEYARFQKHPSTNIQASAYAQKQLRRDEPEKIQDPNFKGHLSPNPSPPGAERGTEMAEPNTKEFQEIANGYRWQVGNFAIRDTRRCIYVCEGCGRGWTDRQRLEAYWSGWRENRPVVVDGEELRAAWCPTAEFKGIRSRHINGMYLSMGLKKGMVNYLHQFAEDFLEAVKGGRETLMVWTNIFKTVAYEDPHQKIAWKELKERAEDYVASGDEGAELPAQAVWICFGADVQQDRVEFLFFGWGEGQECWVLEWTTLNGDFDMPSMQKRVQEFLDNKRFKHPVLGELTVSAGAFDSGHQTRVKAVYQFCARNTFKNWWSVKGFDNALGAVYQVAKEKVYGGKRFNLNVDYLKTVLFDRLLNKEPGPRYIHFPKEEVTVTDAPAVAGGDPVKRVVRTRFGELFYNQLCSEKRVVVKTGKKPREGFKLQWVKVVSSARNEVLDMTVYAFGVYEISRQEEAIASKWKEVQGKLQHSAYARKQLRRDEPGDGKGQMADGKEERKIPTSNIQHPEKHQAAGKPGKKRIRIRSPFGGFR